MPQDSLYLIDPGVDAIDILRSALPAGALQQTLQRGDDLLRQILQILPEQGVGSLHLFSHASPGQLDAAAGLLALDSLPAQAARLAAIGERLGVQGEILLYGCNLAAGTQGQAFITQLARLTGCRVAASSLPVGMTDTGPRWQLDQHSAPLHLDGNITALRSSVLQCNNYPARLATLTGTNAAESLLGSSSDDNLSGLEGDDSLYGYAGNDTLLGGLGNNLLYGGIGNDQLFCDLGDDSLYGDDGNDRLDGGDGADYRDGGSGNDSLDGWFGDDSLHGDAGADSLYGYFGNDTLRGNDGNDLLIGEEGNDYLDGGNGDDTLRGGAGDDTYVVNSSGDLIEEFANGGNDRVIATLSYSLGQYIERLTLSGSASLSGTGNNLNNLITGNSAANTLDGGSGADTLIGGDGNDTYLVDNSGDVVTETGDDSSDSVISTLTSHTLASLVENLTLSGSAAINGTGNSLDNRITGTSAANRLGGGDGNDTLDGAGGGDTLNGGNGNDVYYIDSINDAAVESTAGGTDTLICSVSRTLGTNLENLTLTGTLALSGIGNASANRLTGNAAANSLNGSAGNDTLTGGGGRDVLTGGSGSDFFDFNASSETGITSTTRDLIADFVSGTDHIDLSSIDANAAMAGDQAFTKLLASSTAFTAAGQLRFGGGVLYGNTDTDTAAEFSIALSGITRISLTDFIL